MNAYRLVLFMIFINAGIAFAASMNIFGPELTAANQGWSEVFKFFFVNTKLGGVGINIATLFAGSLAFASVAVAFLTIGSGGKTPSSVAISAFSVIFIASLGSTMLTFSAIAAMFDNEAISIFMTLFGIVQILIFVIALMDMTGGQTSNV